MAKLEPAALAFHGGTFPRKWESTKQNMAYPGARMTVSVG